MSTESDFLAWIKQQQQPSPFVPLPAGDDLAVLKWPAGDLLLIGVDQVLDGVHFDSAIHSPRAIGIKAVNRNLSDCAAMACLPAAAVVSVALPRGSGFDYARELYLGLRDAADPFDCPIVGGDTGTWDGKLAVTVTILGRSDGVEPITRIGARPGDGIYVTGRLGGSILGRHMTFSPRVREGRALAASGVVTSMIDLSDGLSRDLPRICAGALLEESAIPIHADARTDRADNRTPIERALHDGEDYELLFTASATPPIGTRIGTVRSEAGFYLHRPNDAVDPIVPKGWEHTL
jgi:thiamine-monophosphate kinase